MANCVGKIVLKLKGTLNKALFPLGKVIKSEGTYFFGGFYTYFIEG